MHASGDCHVTHPASGGDPPVDTALGDGLASNTCMGVDVIVSCRK